MEQPHDEARSSLFHPRSLVDGTVGARTRVWANAHVMAGARVGEDCNVGEGVFVEGGAVVGDRVTLKNGTQIWDGVTLEDDVFVGPNATFCNDKYPRSRQYGTIVRTVVRRGASLGANCTILPGVTIGEDAVVGAGAVVTHHVSARTVVAGNPARHLKFVDAVAPPAPSAGPATGVAAAAIDLCGVRGVSIVMARGVEDRRGKLCVAEYASYLPWAPKRHFVIYDVPAESPKELRGNHGDAHRIVKQCFICLAGAVDVLIDDGVSRASVRLSDPRVGLLMDTMVWSSQNCLLPGTVLLALCSEKHMAEGEIHDHAEFVREVTALPTPSKVPFK